LKELTAHFDRFEFTTSQWATRLGIVNQPTSAEWTNLWSLADTCLEPARAILGPIYISSGFRCPELNAAVGGAINSQHMKGEAADLIPFRSTLPDLFRWFYSSETPWDQLIWEFGEWVHVSHRRGGPQRRQALLAYRKDSHTIYAPMSPERVQLL